MVTLWAVVLTLEAALAEARENAPQLLQARAATAAAQARVDQARSGLLPQVQAGASAGRTTTNSRFLPETSFGTEGAYDLSLSASQLLWDFGKTKGAREAAAATAESLRCAEEVTSQSLAADVRTAYGDAQAQKALLAVAAEALENERRHLEQIQAFVEAGTRPPIDVLQARTNRANAQVRVVEAENAYLAAKARLDLARGAPGGLEYDVEDEPPGEVPGEDETTDALLARALEANPELRALAARIEAQQRSLEATAGGYWPVFDAATSLTDRGPAPGDLVWNWQGALRLTWPLYQGGLTTAQESAARHDLSGLQAQALGVRQQLRLRLHEARLGVRAGKAAAAASEEALLAARERLKLAEGRYETGLGNAIELSDAQLALTNAQAQKVRALQALTAARARLLQSLGGG